MYYRKRGKEMELREAIDKLFEMTDEQRFEIFGWKNAKSVLDDRTMDEILGMVREFYSEPKYGDVYVDETGYKFIILDAGWGLSEKYECPQKMSSDIISDYYTKTGKNVADKLKDLFE
jgi:hypothetical protein